MLCYKFGCLLFSSSPDFANHNDTRGLRVLFKVIQAVNKIGAVYRIAADTNAGGLPNSLQG